MLMWNPLLFSQCWTVFVSLSLSSSSLDRNWKWLEQKISLDNGINHQNGVKGDGTRSCIWVMMDVENVRGKTGFAMTHLELLEKTSRWIHASSNSFAVVSLVVDHGSIASDNYLEELKLGITFAGPNSKADDVIARDVTSTLIANKKNKNTITVVVVTSDNGLMQRCRYAATSKQQKSSLYIWSPLRFLDDINRIQEQYERQQENQRDDYVSLVCNQLHDISLQETDQNIHGNNNLESFLNEISEDLQLASSLLNQEKNILEKNESGKQRNNKKTRNDSNKVLRKLRRRIEQLRSKIGRKYAASSPIIRVKSAAFIREMLCNDNDLSEEKKLLYTQWHDIMSRNHLKQSTQYKEQTKDRIVLAERLRQQIIQYKNNNCRLSSSSNSLLKEQSCNSKNHRPVFLTRTLQYNQKGLD
jgi:hypothetical protein